MAANRKPSIMTVKEAANCLGLHETRVYRLSQRGLIPAYRVGGSWRFLKDEIEEWLAKRVSQIKKQRGDKNAS